MPSSTASTDRRTALRLRHRHAILDATRLLIAEHGASGVSVQSLAERADVSRRTIFNHFRSIEEVITTSCAEELSRIMDSFAQEAGNGTRDGSLSAIFAGLVNALKTTDLPASLTYLWEALGGFEPGDQRSSHIMQAAFSRTTASFGLELAQRHNNVDVFEVQLLASMLMHGTGVVAEHWITTVGASTDAQARAAWEELMDRMIQRVARAYFPAPTSDSTGFSAGHGQA